MKFIALPIALWFISLNSYSQLNCSQCTVISVDSLEQKIDRSDLIPVNLNANLKKAFRYSDQSGNHIILFTEEFGRYKIDNDSAVFRIMAVDFRQEADSYKIEWNYKDSVYPDFVVGQQDVHFDFDFSEINMNEQDSLQQVIIGYRSLTNFYIIIPSKNKIVKIDIRFRGFEKKKMFIDKEFYSLPNYIQNKIREKIKLLDASNPSFLPKNWERGLMKKKTIID